MAGSSLLALIDDIAGLLDDVVSLTKLAAKDTAGVLGDDLALNAEQVSGVRPDRELPVIWAVAKGSARNKAILVPLAIVISAIAPWAILPMLMLGGAYLCFEGAEKVAHRLLHPPGEDAQRHAELVQAVTDPAIDLVAFERSKIRAAIRTDLILSAELIVIALGATASATFAVRVGVLCGVAVLLTVGVYGIVAGIVKLDDLGLLLSRRGGPLGALGRWILVASPWLMRGLGVVGTAAMFLVGGGIFTEGIAPLHHALGELTASVAGQPGYGPVLAAVLPSVCKAFVGVVVGAVLVALFSVVQRVRRKRSSGA
ncbi:MAG: DUF808 domain-containing protein [Kofleriaceae bacterium]